MWRALDFGTNKVYLRAETHRVICPEHGVHQQKVSWARPKSRFTYDFEQMVCWMAKHLDRTAVSLLMRISWNTIGPIITRVEKSFLDKFGSKFDNLKRIGIDETSFKKGHKYITIVLNHDTGSVIWVGEGHDFETLSKFFEMLTPEQRASIELVSADGAKWIAKCVDVYCPNAKRCIDPYHVVSWIQDVLDKLRMQTITEVRKKMNAAPHPKKKGRPQKGVPHKTQAEEEYRQIKGSKYALQKNPENLLKSQMARLNIILLYYPKLARAYRLKEELRLLFKLPLEDVEDALYKWRHRAWTSRIPEFVEFQRKIKRHKNAIIATIKYGLSNARIEAVNNKIKLAIRKAYGFRNTENLFSMIMLCCGGYEIELPGR